VILGRDGSEDENINENENENSPGMGRFIFNLQFSIFNRKDLHPFTPSAPHPLETDE